MPRAVSEAAGGAAPAQRRRRLVHHADDVLAQVGPGLDLRRRPGGPASPPPITSTRSRRRRRQPGCQSGAARATSGTDRTSAHSGRRPPRDRRHHDLCDASRARPAPGQWPPSSPALRGVPLVISVVALVAPEVAAESGRSSALNTTPRTFSGVDRVQRVGAAASGGAVRGHDEEEAVHPLRHEPAVGHEEHGRRVEHDVVVPARACSSSCADAGGVEEPVRVRSRGTGRYDVDVERRRPRQPVQRESRSRAPPPPAPARRRRPCPGWCATSGRRRSASTRSTRAPGRLGQRHGQVDGGGGLAVARGGAGHAQDLTLAADALLQEMAEDAVLVGLEGLRGEHADDVLVDRGPLTSLGGQGAAYDAGVVISGPPLARVATTPSLAPARCATVWATSARASSAAAVRRRTGAAPAEVPRGDDARDAGQHGHGRRSPHVVDGVEATCRASPPRTAAPRARPSAAARPAEEQQAIGGGRHGRRRRRGPGSGSAARRTSPPRRSVQLRLLVPPPERIVDVARRPGSPAQPLPWRAGAGARSRAAACGWRSPRGGASSSAGGRDLGVQLGTGSSFIRLTRPRVETAGAGAGRRLLDRLLAPAPPSRPAGGSRPDTCRCTAAAGRPALS